MKVRISDLSDQEKEYFFDEVETQRGADFVEFCVSRDLGVLGCMSLDDSKLGKTFWENLFTNGNPERMSELAQLSMDILLKAASSEVPGDDLVDGLERIIKSAKDMATFDGKMIVGNWYGSIIPGSNGEIRAIFQFNGKSTGRHGWGPNGVYSTNLDSSLDEEVSPCPEDMLILAFASEAEKRGYSVGTVTESGVIHDGYRNDFVTFEKLGKPLDYCFFYRNIKVCRNGDWNNSPISKQNSEDELRSLLLRLNISLN